MPVIRLDPRAVLAWLRARAGATRPAARTIPILPSGDLDRTAEFYRGAGMEELARYEGYLLMGFRGVELHFRSTGARVRVPLRSVTMVGPRPVEARKGAAPPAGVSTQLRPAAWTATPSSWSAGLDINLRQIHGREGAHQTGAA